jgi:hypothetical protein
MHFLRPSSRAHILACTSIQAVYASLIQKGLPLVEEREAKVVGA